MQEERLSGGNMSRVVRVENTVRRSTGPWTATVQRLLAHVRGRGVDWVPKPLGYDEQGREVLSFIAGDVPHAMPDWIWSEVLLAQVGRALRQWHDATSDFDPRGAVWYSPAREPREVICHNDFAPYNCVFQQASLVGAIDFDLCSPGPRVWDIAYTAYRFVPLMPPRAADVADAKQERSPFSEDEGSVRLAAFLRAYTQGAAELPHTAAAVVSAAIDRLRDIAVWTTTHVARTGDRQLENHARMYRAHADWLAERPGRFGEAT
ncbi:MAG TPA: phosphotransferase [Polyangiaceae bacterium]|nr:phosphotransferase [Polyangiaceae bacterium]